jgi:peroxiredoxin
MPLQLSKSALDARPIDGLVLSLGGAEGSISLTDLEGRVIVLFVFGIDCGNCRHLARSLSNFRLNYLAEVAFIGVCVRSDCAAELVRFREETEAEFPLTHCRSRELCQSVGIPQGTWLFYPSLIFIDRQQRMRGFVVGGDEFFENAESNLQAILCELGRELYEPAGDGVEVRA